jgi:hypothetical protein
MYENIAILLFEARLKIPYFWSYDVHIHLAQLYDR